MWNFGFFIIMTVSLLSCSPGGDQSHPVVKKYTESLNGKSEDQIIDLKYSEMLVECSVVIRQMDFNEVEYKSPVQHRFTFELPKDLDKRKKIKVKWEKVKGSVTYLIGDFKILNRLDYSSKNHGKYILRHTPVVSLVAEEKLVGDEDIYNTDKKTQLFDLIENVGTFEHKSHTTIDFGLKTVKELDCELKTYINQGYEYQFLQVKD